MVVEQLAAWELLMVVEQLAAWVQAVWVQEVWVLVSLSLPLTHSLIH